MIYFTKSSKHWNDLRFFCVSEDSTSKTCKTLDLKNSTVPESIFFQNKKWPNQKSMSQIIKMKRTATYPEVWKQSHVRPDYKKGIESCIKSTGQFLFSVLYPKDLSGKFLLHRTSIWNLISACISMIFTKNDRRLFNLLFNWKKWKRLLNKWQK